jgi:hypothetical protein
MGRRGRKRRKLRKSLRNQQRREALAEKDYSVQIKEKQEAAISKNELKKLKNLYNCDDRIAVEIELDDFLKDDFEMIMEKIV